MNIQDFTYLIKHPTEITKEQTAQLEDVIVAFPYFQSARALYLKGLKKQGSFRYNQRLKETAAHTTDRSVLFELITSPIFIDEKIEKEKAPISIVKKEPENQQEAVAQILEIGKPIEFKEKEVHSFREWLQLSSLKPVKKSEENKKNQKKFDLIDKFIANNPKIKPVQKTESKAAVLTQEPTNYETLMTETLARVYLEQKKYKNAIKAYRILSLKYPEKSAFFANRIKAIKILDKK